MEEEFDRKLAGKIRDELWDHSEKYSHGAWETFQSKKKKRKGLIYWYLTGTAASLWLLFSLHALLQGPELENESLTQTTVAGNFHETIASPSDSVRSMPPGVAGKDLPATGSKDTGIRKKDIPEYRIKDMKNTGGTGKRTRETIGQIASACPWLPAPRESIPMLLEPAAGKAVSDSAAIMVNLHKEEQKEKRLLALGILLSPDYGTRHKDMSSARLSGLGYGITMEMKLSPSVSAAAGMVLSNQLIKHKEWLPSLESNIDNRKESTETAMMVLNIPVLAKYRLPVKKKKIFIAGGVSSYYVLRQEFTSRTTLTREVQVVENAEGGTWTHTITESLTVEDSYTTKKNAFYPAGAINLSIGYSAPLSERFSLEIAPFYKYPLTPLTEDRVKFATTGISIKVIFSGG